MTERNLRVYHRNIPAGSFLHFPFLPPKFPGTSQKKQLTFYGMYIMIRTYQNICSKMEDKYESG